MAASLPERILVAGREERLAFVAADGTAHTFGQLAELVAARAATLRALGVGPGVPVALFADDGLQLPASYLAVIEAGGVVVPVNNRFGPGDVAGVAAVLGASIWLTDPHRSDLLADALSGSTGHEVRDITTLELLGPSAGTGPRRALPVPVDETDPLDVLAFTSGTTGTPKGACLRRSALDVALRSSARSYRLGEEPVLLYSAAMAFVPTVITQILGTLALGGQVHVLQSRDPDAWIDQVERVQATFTYVPTPELAGFSEAASRHDGLGSIRGLMHAGSIALPEVLARAASVLGDRLLEAWGMTETCGAPITVTVPGDLEQLGLEAFARTAGRPVPEATVQLDVAEGEGELLVGAGFVCHGYLQEEGFVPVDRTAFPTGDLGVIDGQGYVSITGRRKELIITGGINVAPVEVEQCIAALDGVREVAVFGVADARWGEAVNAAIVPAPGREVDPQVVIAHVRERLAPFKAPKQVHLVSELPRNASQKVMRHVLSERFTNDHQPQGADDA